MLEQVRAKSVFDCFGLAEEIAIRTGGLAVVAAGRVLD